MPARGIGLGAPRAVQVADRWHLLLNLRQMAERWLAGVHGRLRRLPPIPGRPAGPARRTSAFPRSRAERAASAESRARWKALYDEVRRRIAGGEPLLTISRRMGLARGTVRKFADAESFPERAVQPPGRSILDPHLDHLEARLAAGCENAMALWRELRERGFCGTARQVHRWLGPRRTTRSKHTPQRERGAPPPAPSPAGDSAPALPSPKQLAWYLTHPWDRLTEQEGAAVARLEQDGAAVKAALTTPWSSGQTEGQVGKLKMLKRQTFGRSSFDFLRRRVLLAA